MKIWKMKKVKILVAVVVVLSLTGLAVSLTVGGSNQGEALTQEDQYTVQRGDITVDITAGGNLELGCTEELVLEVAGTVAEVLVEEGDSVEEGQMLAKLDTSEWDKELINLEMDLVQADINLRNAELALEEAEEPYSDEDIEIAEADVDSAELALDYAEQQLDEAYDSGDAGQILQAKSNVIKAEANLLSAEARLEEMEDAPDQDEVAIKELQLQLIEARFEDANEALEEALENSPEIIAPFDGFITKVNVEGGDEVMKGTVAVQLADPNKFEAAILVGETDITQLKEGVNATVQVDALSGLTLPATVTHISPTATIQSGVVNYNVKVEVASLEEMLQEQEAAQQEAIEKLQQGELPENLRLAIEEGRMTQEQAEERMQQMLEGMQDQTAQTPTAVQEDYQLRDGLSVTVTIVVKEANDVLLVPNAAITSQRGQTYVQVVSPDGTIEQRSITAGINDAQYTEVTEGLNEGEQIIIPEGTATAPTTSTTREGGAPGGMLIPGMGRP